jgi:hypothetical protein
MSIIGQPPGVNCGAMSPLTAATRPAVQITPEQCILARKLKRQGHGVGEIASVISATTESVLQALAPMRMRNPAASRATLNVTMTTHQFVLHQRRDGEPIWRTTGRLLTELVILRAEVIALRARRGSFDPP